MQTTNRVWRVTVVKRYIAGEYDYEVYIHRDTVRLYKNPRALSLVYVAIGRFANEVDMTSIGREVITRFYIRRQ